MIRAREPDQPAVRPPHPTVRRIETAGELLHRRRCQYVLHLLGGYPATRITARTVQVYDIASDRWELGPQLPQPNNHGMSAGVNGKIYLIGGQTTADDPSYVDTVYELDPASGTWVAKARMPTARSSGVAVVHNGRIYVAGGRPPRGNDFAVYDPTTDSWQVLPDLPTQRNHISGAAINGTIHVVGGRQGPGFVAPGNDSARSVRPANEDLDDCRSDAARPQRLPIHGVYGSAFVDGLIWVSGGGTNIGGNNGSTHNQVFHPTVSCE